MGSSKGEIDPFVDNDSVRRHGFSYSVSVSLGTELASYLKNSIISKRNSSKCCPCPQKSSLNSFKKYLTVISLLRPRQSGSNENLMLDRVKFYATSIICSCKLSSKSSLTVTIHFSNFKGAYSQSSITSSFLSMTSYKLIKFQCLATFRKCVMFPIISLSSSQDIFNIFLTKTLVSSFSTSPISPKGYCSPIGTRNSFSIVKNEIKQYDFDYKISPALRRRKQLKIILYLLVLVKHQQIFIGKECSKAYFQM